MVLFFLAVLTCVYYCYLYFLLQIVACQERSNDVSWEIVQESHNRVSNLV